MTKYLRWSLATEKTLAAITKDGQQVTHDGLLKWARPCIDADRRGAAPRLASDIARPGDLIRVERNGDEWRLGQVPNIQGLIVSIRSLALLEHWRTATISISNNSITRFRPGVNRVQYQTVLLRGRY